MGASDDVLDIEEIVLDRPPFNEGTLAVRYQ